MPVGGFMSSTPSRLNRGRSQLTSRWANRFLSLSRHWTGWSL